MTPPHVIHASTGGSSRPMRTMISGNAFGESASPGWKRVGASRQNLTERREQFSPRAGFVDRRNSSAWPIWLDLCLLGQHQTVQIVRVRRRYPNCAFRVRLREIACNFLTVCQGQPKRQSCFIHADDLARLPQPIDLQSWWPVATQEKHVAPHRRASRRAHTSF